MKDKQPFGGRLIKGTNEWVLFTNDMNGTISVRVNENDEIEIVTYKVQQDIRFKHINCNDLKLESFEG